ncbi:MAG: tRNA threonylcarbamoyladenosine dehydratase [bacterium]|nr:tRNA threonylcarbamoyladenosine dehydratase [bacterium]
MLNSSSDSAPEGIDPRHYRTVLFYGEEGFARLRAAHVTIVGLGGVGGHAAVNLARSGIGALRVVDFDEVSPSSLNRSPFAGPRDVGRNKAEVLSAYLQRICPDVAVTATAAFCSEETLAELVPTAGSGRPDLVIDAIDSLNTKVGLLARCWKEGVPVLASLGAAGKRDAGAVRTGDLFESTMCPLAKKVRQRLHRLGVTGPIGAVWSLEQAVAHRPDAPREKPEAITARGGKGRARNTLASQMTIPGVFGYALASLALDFIAERTAP